MVSDEEADDNTDQVDLSKDRNDVLDKVELPERFLVQNKRKDRSGKGR